MKKLLALIIAAVLCLTCFAACGNNNQTPDDGNSTPTQVVYDVDDAAAYLKNMYKKYLTETETAADYTLVSQVMKGGVIYTVTWTTDNEGIKVIPDEENKQVKIDLDEQTKVDITYKLTATITDPDGKTATLTFDLKVPKYVLSSWSDYMAAEAGKAVVVQGYVAAVHSQSEGNKYNQLYLHDVNNKGGYYIYSIADSVDPVKDLGIKAGMLVSVTGTKDIYSGTHEVKDAVVTVLSDNAVDLAPLDITQLYKDATSLKDESLTSKLGMLVTIKGVEITDQDLSEKSMYMNFKLSGLTSYIRVYATDCPASVSDAGQEKIIADHAAKKGYSADVTGVVVMYSGAIYLNPVSDTPFKYGKLIQRTDEEKVQVEIEDLLFEKDVALNKTLTLPLKGQSYEDVVITWASNSDAITIDGNKAKIVLQSEATTASITGTFTLGTITKTATFTFNLAAKPSVVPQAVANPVANTAYKLFMSQTARGEFLYFTGEMNGYYGASTTDFNEAIDVYVEPATNGYYMYFNKGGDKYYITMAASGTHINFVFQTDKPAAPFAVDTEHDNAPIMTVGEDTYFIGTYGTYYTFGTSKTSKYDTTYVAYLGTMVDSSSISDADKVAAEKNALTMEDEIFANAEINLASKGSIYNEVAITWSSDNACAVVADGKVTITLGSTEQVVNLTATLTLGSVTETKVFTINVDKIVTMPYETGKEYLLGMVHGNLENKTLYFNGEMHSNGYQFTSTEAVASAVKVILEEDGTGYQIYFMNGTTKTYITIVPSGDYNNPAFTTTKPATPWNYDSSLGTFTIVSGSKTYFLGTRNDRTQDTFSSCETKYTSNFKAVLMPVNAAPYKLNTEYVMQMIQENAGKTVYVSGGISNNYMSTSEDLSAALKIIVELDGEGYQLYYMDGTTKTYLTMVMNGTYCNGAYVTTKPTTVWNWDATLNTLTMDMSNGNTYFYGTRNDRTFTTVGPCESKYTENFKALLVDPATLGGNEGSGSDSGNEGGNTGSGSGSTTPTGALAATFTFGADDATMTNENNQVQDGTGITEYTEDNNGYTLTLTDLSKVYAPAYDATGKAGIKLGSSSVVGTFTFTVPADVKSVKIYVTGYKAKTSKVSVNGGAAQTLTKSSANGEYDVITIDTSSTKTITFATVSGATRVKINTIEFYK